MNKLLILTKKAKAYETLLRNRNLPDLELYPAESPDQGRRFIGDSNIILGVPMMVAELLAEAEQLLWVQSTYAGIESLCAPGLRTDYLLTGVKGVFGPLMSEYVFAYILAFERHLFEIRQNQKKSFWKDIPYRSLKGLTIGICGLGSIGLHIAETAFCFGMRVRGLRRSRVVDVPKTEKVYPSAELHDFLKALDYLVITLPDTFETRRLFTIDIIQKMKPSAVLINIGRGAVVVENDLIHALQTQTIRGAILDVFEDEPLSKTSPLWNMPNVIVTPHNAGISFPADIVKIFCDNYKRFLNKRPLKYAVDFKKGY